MDDVLYIAQGSYRDYVSQEVRPAILVRECSMQLISICVGSSWKVRGQGSCNNMRAN